MGPARCEWTEARVDAGRRASQDLALASDLSLFCEWRFWLGECLEAGVACAGCRESGGQTAADGDVGDDADDAEGTDTQAAHTAGNGPDAADGEYVQSCRWLLGLVLVMGPSDTAA